MDNGFYWLSKAFWAIASPDSLLVLLSLCGVIMLLIGRIRWAKLCLVPMLTLTLLITILPIGQWLLVPLETRFATKPQLPQKVDGIIVLSGPEDVLLTQYWQLPTLSGGSERNWAFLSLAKQYPGAKLVFTGGGHWSSPGLTQAYVAKQLYQSQGIDTANIIFEDKARNTAENASLSYKLVKPQPGENWVMVTSAFHMPRSVGLFCNQGWKVLPYPVDHRTLPGQHSLWHWKFSRNLELFNLAVREWVGLTAYYLWDKIPSWLPQSCQWRQNGQ